MTTEQRRRRRSCAYSPITLWSSLITLWSSLITLWSSLNTLWSSLNTLWSSLADVYIYRLAEAKQGYFHDYNRARKGGGGKLWIAPSVLIREDRANYFPDISGKNLLGTNVHTTDLFAGKATLVSIISTRLSEEHVQTFSQPVLEDLEGHPRFQSVTINHQPNSLKTWIVSMFTSSLKRTIPKEYWGNYIYATSSWSELDILQPLNLDNHLLGYTFLVDHNCKVRWAGCGEATEEERQNLRRAAAVLVGRMKGGSIKAEGEASA
ncbi:hypothetical protein, variant [Cryptococcus amylolentus CBS 6039]|uniref:Mitochondrial ATPase complex subunit ATP10 n=1 Tax=Cryptococcus amylolentus CBS 6039 TaxID=1295533 RepID=A0A1E3HRL3_9TREE|nr:hypothetical protein, variant [Cryptococcus amylolentus CBS 6039]ODN78984.1 hypothetical protein, variant [Cryptococcus amylolentus CBS 6039]